MAELLGYRVDEMIGRPSLDFIDERQHEAARAAQERRRSGTKEQFDFELRRRDGSPLWVAVSAAPVHDEHSRYAGAIAMLSDVSARRRTEQALRESETRVRAVLDANPDTIVRVSRDGEYLDIRARPGAEPFLPVPQREFIGRNVR